MPLLETILTKIFGSKHERDVRRITPIVETVNLRFEEMNTLSDDELRAKTEEFKKRLEDGETLDDILFEKQFDQIQHGPIRDFRCDLGHQPFLVDRVEVLLDVNIHNPCPSSREPRGNLP